MLFKHFAKSAVMKQIDSKQFGTTSKSSTSHALKDHRILFGKLMTFDITYMQGH